MILDFFTIFIQRLISLSYLALRFELLIIKDCSSIIEPAIKSNCIHSKMSHKADLMTLYRIYKDKSNTTSSLPLKNHEHVVELENFLA